LKKQIFVLVTIIVGILSTLRPVHAMGAKGPYAGSEVCRECHEKFHTLWSTSWHGKASRPYSSELAENELIPQKEDIAIGQYRYRYEPGKVVEIGPEGTKQYPIELVIGGKVTYNFLTTMSDGWFQDLPIGYDREKKEWFDAVSMDVYRRSEDGSVDWKRKAGRLYTACPNCHVSQYSPTYDISAVRYKSTWEEPGVNCEICHGPAGDHIKIARKAPKGQPLEKLGLLRPKTMTAEQRNDMCNSCHGHIMPLTASFKPGDRFFDHFNLGALELDAFYPDGRGKGETFTMTNWLMNPCAKKAKLDCMHCHTSSGRYRFKDPEKANNVCLPCHSERVKNAAAHTHHQADSPGNQCISCHMSPTYYNRMKQSDHSMLPPTPVATIVFGSPNACNYCHSDKDASWADKQVRSWHSDDYQAPVLRRARLIDEAKKRDWQNLPAMLEYIESKDRDEIFATSLIRLLLSNRDGKIIPVLLTALKDRSPLVRSAAAQALSFRHLSEADTALTQAVRDDFLVVRMGAISGLTLPPFDEIKNKNDKAVTTAINEVITSLMLHPDHWTSYDVIGNLYQRIGMLAEAETAYKTALEIEPHAVSALLNISTVYRKRGHLEKAVVALEQAILADPGSTPANFFLGLLKYEKKDFLQAEKYLRIAFNQDSHLDTAAYTLSLIASQHDLVEATRWCKIAMSLSPMNPRYAYTLAQYQDQAGNPEDAISILRKLVSANLKFGDAYLLLGEIYTKLGNKQDAINVYSQALAVKDLSSYYQRLIAARLAVLR
jgi:tetratricopeptide (TPR) repeat protein